jgi:hypothetical protein
MDLLRESIAAVRSCAAPLPGSIDVRAPRLQPPGDMA